MMRPFRPLAAAPAASEFAAQVLAQAPRANDHRR